MNFRSSGRPLALAGLGLLLLAAPALQAHGDGMMSKAMLEHMKKDLKLSDDQYGQVKDEWKADKDACQVIDDKMTQDVDALKGLVDKKASDDDLKPAIAAVKADHVAMQAQMATHMDAMQAILTPRQQAVEVIKMSAIMKHKMGAHGMKDRHKKAEDKDDDGDSK